jgi:hypothetical protein
MAGVSGMDHQLIGHHPANMITSVLLKNGL